MKKNNLIVAPEVKRDVADAIDWYEQRHTGLGEKFLQSINGCYESIVRSPDSYGIIDKGIRQGIVRRFPYSILYKFTDSQIIILCVCHHSRNPQFLNQRLSPESE